MNETIQAEASVSREQFADCLNADLSSGNFFHTDAAKWEISAHMFSYSDDLLEKWLGWLSPRHGLWNDCLGYHVPEEWVEASRQCHQQVVPSVLGRPYDHQKYRHIDFYNGTDYLFQTLQGPSENILDFGAGYGRQSFLWTSLNSPVTYVAVDGIEGSYLLQNRVCQALPEVEFVDYVTDGESFSIPAKGHGKQIRHLPTWRLDLLPDDYFDLITCVQVLPELPGKLIRPLLDEFQRVIRPGGKLYIRDCEYWRPSHNVRIGRYLLEHGWRLAFKHPGIHTRDIHSVPRIWTHTAEDTSDLTSVRARLKQGLKAAYRNKLGIRDLMDLTLPK